MSRDHVFDTQVATGLAVVNYRNNDGPDKRSLWQRIADMPKDVGMWVLRYRGADGKARKDVYGLINDAPRDTVDELLGRKVRSAFDGKEYTFLDLVVWTNAQANAAKAQSDAINKALGLIAAGDSKGAEKVLKEATTPKGK